MQAECAECRELTRRSRAKTAGVLSRAKSVKSAKSRAKTAVLGVGVGGEPVVRNTGLIGGRWKMGREVGEGSFGKVYEAVDVRSGERVAVKVEFESRRRPFLQREYEAYQSMRNTDTQVVGIAEVFYYGRWRGKPVLAMQFLGDSLDELARSVGGRLSVKSVAMIGIQMLRRLQLMHHKGFLHRDVKPENMLMGRTDRGRVYLVDFGLAKRYVDASTRQHIRFRTGLSFMGTSRYASLSAHRGWEQGRRDDVEALGFVLLYLLNGGLPWMGIKESDQSRKWERVSEIKMKTRIAGLCKGMSELHEFFRYVRSVRFEQRPDYAYLRRLLRFSLKRNRHAEDRVFDWM